MAKITISALLPGGGIAHREVEGVVHGAWAAHEDAYGHDYRVTFLRFGLAVPYDFDTMAGAKAAAKAISALRTEWETISGEDIKALYGKIIMKICSERAGTVTNGPKGPMVPLDEQHPIPAE